MFQGPVMQIGEDPDMVFPLNGPFADGYHNDIQLGSDNMNWRSHHTIFYWMKGYFKPMTIELNLAVGLDDGGKGFLETPAALQTVLKKLLAMAIVPSHSSGKYMPLKAVPLRVGHWFRRKGYIQDIDFTFMPPWEISTGEPLRADVRFLFVPDFLSDVTYKDTQQVPISQDFLDKGFLQDGKSRQSNAGFAGEGAGWFT